MTVRAVVVGSLVMDLSFRVPHRPEPRTVVIADDFGTFRGGKGYNQAIALARLGARVTMIGAVGADAHGDAFIDALEREGVDASRVVQLRGTATAVAGALITPDGEVAFVQLPGANRQLAPAHCADLPDCDIALLQGEVDPGTSLRVARVIRRRGAEVLLNTAPQDEMTDELVAAASIICANEAQARALYPRLRGGGRGDESPADIASALARDERLAIITLGPRGAVVAGRGDGAVEVTPPPVDTLDATAVSDAFCAALAVALVEGRDRVQAARFACAAAAHTATVRGSEPALPSRDQVEALLATAPCPG